MANFSPNYVLQGEANLHALFWRKNSFGTPLKLFFVFLSIRLHVGFQIKIWASPNRLRISSCIRHNHLNRKTSFYLSPPLSILKLIELKAEICWVLSNAQAWAKIKKLLRFQWLCHVELEVLSLCELAQISIWKSKWICSRGKRNWKNNFQAGSKGFFRQKKCA